MSKSDITKGMEKVGMRALANWLDEEGSVIYSAPAVRDVFVAMTRYHRLEQAKSETGLDRSPT